MYRFNDQCLFVFDFLLKLYTLRSVDQFKYNCKSVDSRRWRRRRKRSSVVAPRIGVEQLIIILYVFMKPIKPNSHRLRWACGAGQREFWKLANADITRRRCDAIMIIDSRAFISFSRFSPSDYYYLFLLFQTQSASRDWRLELCSVASKYARRVDTFYMINK